MSEDKDLKARMTAKRLVIQEGKFFVGISPNVDPNSPPSWYDPVVFKHAQKLFKTYAVM